jgi:hypothetical protein
LKIMYSSLLNHVGQQIIYHGIWIDMNCKIEISIELLKAKQTVAEIELIW